MFFGRLAKWAMIILFFTAIWTPLFLLIMSPAATVSESEKRKLAPFPTLSGVSLTAYPAEFEAYFNDHFGLRRPLIRWYNHFRVLYLGVSSSKSVHVGKNGWLFQNAPVHLRDMQNGWPFSLGELQHWAKILSAKQQWLKEQGVDYLFVFAPSKHLIYPEKLPLSVKQLSNLSRLDQIVDYLRHNTDVNFIDLRPVMLEAKQTMRPYHKTDTHWNDYGAYLAYQAVMIRMQKDLPEARILSLSTHDFMEKNMPGGDLAQNLDLKDVMREVEIVARKQVSVCGKNTAGEQLTIVEQNNQEFSTTCKEGRYRALLFRDSYSLSMMKYFSESFHSIYYHPASPVPLKGIKYLVPKIKPDIVIELRASRWLRTPEG